MSYSLRVRIKNRWFHVQVESLEVDPVSVNVEGKEYEVSLQHLGFDCDETTDHAVTNQTIQGSSFVSPMPGVMVSILVSVGDDVESGTELCIIETMKIQQILRSSRHGIVTRINVTEKEQINIGDSIMEISGKN